MKTLSENRCHGGVQGVYAHASQVCGCDMTFGLFLPEEAERGPVPLIWYLSGLTCTHENAMVKAGAQKWAAEAGVALLAAMSKAPVVPAAILGTNKIFSQGKWFPELRVIYGQPLYFEGKHSDKAALHDFSQKIMDEIARMLKSNSIEP